VDWYIVNELTKNIDSGFNNSIWMSLDPAGRLAMAAPWDFDTSMANRTRWGIADPEGLFLGRNWWLQPDEGGDVAPPSQTRNSNGHYLNRLMADPTFVARVHQRWQQVEDRMDALPAFLQRQADAVAVAANHNYAPTPQGAGMPIGPTFLDNGPGARHPSDTWEGDVADLRDWLTRRVAWLDTVWD
jgi:hypothetical protein